MERKLYFLYWENINLFFSSSKVYNLDDGSNGTGVSHDGHESRKNMYIRSRGRQKKIIS